MSIRGRLKADQMDGFPDDVTKALIGKLNSDGSNIWSTVALGTLPQTIAASGSKFIEAYDAATGLFTARRPTDADLSLSDITTNNVTSSAHGFAPKSPADATQFMNGAATPAFAAVKDSDLSTSDITTNNVSSTKHGFGPKSPADATQFLNGAATPAFAAVKDSDLSTSDITTNNVGTSKHGFAPKSPNDATKYLDGTGAYSVPAGSGGSGALIFLAHQNASGVNSVDFTGFINSAYSVYELFCVDVFWSGAAALLFRVSVGGSWLSGASDYLWAISFGYPTAGGGNGSTGNAQMNTRDVNTTLVTNGVANGSVRFSKLTSSRFKQMYGMFILDTNDVQFLELQIAGRVNNTGSVDGIRVLMNGSVNMTGDFYLYGIKNS
jgi:hypothetical protein